MEDLFYGYHEDIIKFVLTEYYVICALYDQRRWGNLLSKKESFDPDIIITVNDIIDSYQNQLLDYFNHIPFTLKNR